MPFSLLRWYAKHSCAIGIWSVMGTPKWGGAYGFHADTQNNWPKIVCSWKEPCGECKRLEDSTAPVRSLYTYTMGCMSA